MSQDPKTNPPPNGQPKETLEDLVYRSSLSAGNRAVHGANPLIAVPLTIASYAAFCGFAYLLATHTDAGKKVIKGTMGIDLTEQADAPPPPPPPPPPAPAAPSAPAPKIMQRDAPPPPPINPNQDVVPEVAPRELPRQDLTMAYASSQSSSGSGVPGGGVSGSSGPVTGGMSVAGSGTSHVVDFDFSQMKIKFQPPAPPYPPLAKIARIQGTVVVEITVGPDGIPIAAKAVEGPAQLRQTAENYAMAWKFEPAMLNGVPQTARFKLTMPFHLH